MLPILREIYANPLEPQAARDMAVRRIYELAPDEGRRIILTQLAQPYSSLSLSTLELLPDRSLPELNDMLASRAEAGQIEDALILRYATGDIVRRVEQAYLKRNADFDRQKLPHCGGALIYYFLKHDPSFGERELRGDMDKPGAFPACYDIGFQFQSLDRNAYSPALERLAIEFLTSNKVPVKRGAAEVLGKYGSPAAEKPLWDTLEYFHSWWKRPRTGARRSEWPGEYAVRTHLADRTSPGQRMDSTRGRVKPVARSMQQQLVQARGRRMALAA